MFRQMRRCKQELSIEECKRILENQTFGTLALLGDEGYPYSVPISYVSDENKIYFHSAKKGHKIDSINNYDKASFCVVEKDEIVPKEYTTYFRSVICFGKIKVLNDIEESKEAIKKLAIKYNKNDTETNRDIAINKELDFLSIIEFTIEHISGKEAIELVRQRNN